MNKFILLILIFIIPSSAFTQSDEELIKKIREEYYNTQENLKSYKKARVNDSVYFQTNNNEIVKISLIKDNLREEYYFYENAVWPYFVFTQSKKSENRYYFNSDEDYFRMIKWLNNDKLHQKIDSELFKKTEREYLFKGRNLKILASNIKVNKNEIIEIKKKLDSLQLIKYDTIVQRPFGDLDNTDLSEEEVRELMAGDESYYEYLSLDKKIHVFEKANWYDCAGGGSSEIITYKLATGEEITKGEEIKSIFVNSGYYGHNKNYIRYNDGSGTCYEISTISIYGNIFTEEWKKNSCR